ncbi:MAG: hypothetical protein ACXWUG_14720 [Polyangiales bacterium]
MKLWEVALSGDAGGILEAVLGRLESAGPPARMKLAYTATPVSETWRGEVRSAKAFELTWKSGTVLTRRRDVILVEIAEVPITVSAAVAWLHDVPFELASFARIHDWPGYDAPGFSDGHYPHGWACAFRGEGHRRLVSQRWLDHGPWHLTRAGDLSFVAFHDPAADASLALAQARPGHERMGITNSGGFIQTEYVYEHELVGSHLPRLRQQRIIAARRDVSELEMLDACAARLERRWQHPVDTVAYAFLEEERARRHLHELWLRDLWCLAVIEGDEQRLDADYAPAPTPPEWCAYVASSST